MSNFTFRPAKRENTPLIIGVAGPTKSGKTMSALRLAAGLTDQYDRICMLNAEGARGEQYADWFLAKYGKQYQNCNISAPYSPERYTEALVEMAAFKPTVGIIDSASHMHDGPGGLLEYHEAELQRLSKGDENKRDRNNWTAWIKPKAAENKFIYTMLSMECPIILCFRAKEKLKIISGKPPIDLGWQPIAGDRITFETIFTLVLPPHSKGVPDLELSEMRQPFDQMVPNNKPIDEELGRTLALWAKGNSPAPSAMGSDGPRRQEGSSQGAGDAPTFEAKPELVAKKWFIRIEQSPTLEMLNEVGNLIKDAPLSEDDKQIARQLYTARKKQLTTAPKQEIVKETAEPWI